jgi:hypothetical protein
MSVTVPGRSRSASLAPLVKGRAWRHRLLRAPGMSHVGASRPSLQLSEMLDEPTARCSSTHREKQLRRWLPVSLATSQVVPCFVVTWPPNLMSSDTFKGISGPDPDEKLVPNIIDW